MTEGGAGVAGGEGGKGGARPPALEEARARMAALDDALLGLVAERVALAAEIGATKRAAGAATLDTAREAAVIRRAVERGRALGLPDEPVRELFWTLVGLCRGRQLEDR